MNKKRFLKSILATSALAAAMLPAQSAFSAAVRETNAAAVDTSTPADFTGAPVGAVADDTDSVRIKADNVALTVANGNSPTAIDLDGKSGVTITSAGDVNIGSIGPGTGAASTATLTVADGDVVSLTGTASIAENPGPAIRLAANIYTGLGETTIGDGSTLKIDQGAADLTFAGAIKGSADNKGKLQISKTGQTATFTGVVGSTKLNDITVDAQALARFTNNVTATKTTLADNAATTLTFGGAAAGDAAPTYTGDIDITDNGKLATVNKAIIVGDLAMTNNGVFEVAAASDTTFKGDIGTAGQATSATQIGAGGKLTIDTAGGARTIHGKVDGLANHDEGTLLIGDGNAVTLKGVVGGTKRLAHVQTGSGLATFEDAVTTQKLTIGGGHVTTNANVTVGTGGVVANANKLTFTDDATLALEGNYLATGGIIVNNAAAKTLTITPTADTEIKSAIKSEQTTNVHKITIGGAANELTVSEDIGSATNKFDQVNINGNGFAGVHLILNGKKVYVNNHVDVAAHATNSEITFKGASEIVGGKLKASNGANATINLDGTNTNAKVALVDNGNSTFQNFKVAQDAKNAKLTISSDDTDRSLTITDLNFANNTANDASGIVIDLAGIATKGNNYTLSIGGTNNANKGIEAPGAHGGIQFKGSKFTSDDAVNVTLTRQLGVGKDQHLASFDATGHKVKLTGANALHTKDFKASEVELNGSTLGMYNATTTSQVGKFVLDAGNGAIAGDSKLKSGTEVHFAAGNATGRTFTLGKNVVFNGKATVANVGSEGVFIIDGTDGGQNVTLTSVGTSTNKLQAIRFDNAAVKTATLTLGSAAYADELQFHSAGTLNYKGHLKGKVVIGGAHANGTSNLVLKGGSIQGGVATQAAGLGTVTVDTTETMSIGETAGSEFGSLNLKFKQNGGLNFHKNITDNTKLALGTVTNESGTKNVGNLVFNQTQVNTNGNIGTVDLPLSSLTLKENGIFSIANNNGVHAKNVKTDVNNKGTITFGGASTSTNTTFGSSSYRFNKVNAHNSAIEVLDVYSTDFALGGGNVFKARHLDVSGAAGITAAGTVTLKDGGSLVAAKLAHANGNVATEGSATIGKAGAGMTIGGTLDTRGSAAGKTVVLNASKVTGVTNTGAATVKFGNNVAFEENVTSKNGNLDFGNYQATLSNGKTFTFDGSATVTTNGTVTPIIADTLTVGAGNVISIKLNGLTSTGFTLAKKANGAAPVFTRALTDANFAVSGNKFFKAAKVDPATGTLTFERETDVRKVASPEMLAKAHSTDFIQGIVNAAGNIAPTDKLNTWFADVYQNATPEEQIEIVDQLSDNSGATAHVKHINNSATSMARGVVESRGAEITAFGDAHQGVAAGDTADKFGVWAKGTFGTATQKLRKGEAGYKSNSYGAFVGVDTMLNDKASVGLIVGYNNDRMKLKDQKAGGKTKANSWMFGAYGSYDLPQNFFLQGNAAVAQTAVKTKEKRLDQTASGKYDVVGYTAEVRGGYKLRFDNSMIVPTAGLRFNYLGDTSYTETGSGLNDKKVTGNATSGIDAVAGVTLATALDVDGLMLNPEVHMNVDYALTNQAGKVDYSLDGSNVKFNYKGAKPARFGYNFGASVMTQADNIEYGVGYDARISDKYIGHQGSVKVKVSF